MKKWKEIAIIGIIAVVSVMLVKYVLVTLIAPHVSSDLPSKIAGNL